MSRNERTLIIEEWPGKNDQPNFRNKVLLPATKVKLVMIHNYDKLATRISEGRAVAKAKLYNTTTKKNEDEHLVGEKEVIISKDDMEPNSLGNGLVAYFKFNSLAVTRSGIFRLEITVYEKKSNDSEKRATDTARTERFHVF
jgi:hypothetical protein